MRHTRRITLKRGVIQNVLTALNYIDNAHQAITSAIKEEKEGSLLDRNDLFEYGISDAHIDKVKLANIKKGILSITKNQRYKEDHDERTAEDGINRDDGMGYAE